MDEILCRISHGETLTQACASNPDYPSPSVVIDWVHENRHNRAERYARARHRHLERWSDDLVATMLAIKAMVGRVAEAACYLVTLTAYPLVQRALGEPVRACAGYAASIGDKRRMQIGHRWRSEEWAQGIDASASSHLRPLQDVHTWLETATHVIDFSTRDTMGDIDGDWPPLAY